MTKSTDKLTKCVWLVDTIRRYGRISRERLTELWRGAPFFDGSDLARRTFYKYRNDIEEIFGVEIVCNPATYEYSIAEDSGADPGSVSDWLLNAMATNALLASSREVSDRIVVEEVPSARHHLSTVIEALRNKRCLVFDYHPYTRSRATRDIVIEPYFLKIFRQRWYLVGFVPADGKIKTYALDRVVKMEVSDREYMPDPDFQPAEYFRDSFGIVVPESEPRRMVLKVDPNLAKYFRALPLHHSQQEMVGDSYSLFTYRMHISQDLVEELLRYGARITVQQPPELRLIVKRELRKALDNYEE